MKRYIKSDINIGYEFIFKPLDEFKGVDMTDRLLNMIDVMADVTVENCQIKNGMYDITVSCEPSKLSNIQTLIENCGFFRYFIQIPSNLSNNSKENLNTVLDKNERIRLFGEDPVGDIAIPEGYAVIDDSAFEDCHRLTHVKIPDSITRIGNYAFLRCTILKNLDIPDTVMQIGRSAFEDCIGLMSLNIGNGITSVNSFAFSDCDSLTHLKIGNSVKLIDESAFSYCTSLTDIIIPASVQYINDDAFAACKNLKDVVIMNETIGISYSAFDGCPNIEIRYE